VRSGSQETERNIYYGKGDQGDLSRIRNEIGEAGRAGVTKGGWTVSRGDSLEVALTAKSGSKLEILEVAQKKKETSSPGNRYERGKTRLKEWTWKPETRGGTTRGKNLGREGPVLSSPSMTNQAQSWQREDSKQ